MFFVNRIEEYSMYEKLEKQFELAANTKNAKHMAKYLRNQFDFYGIQSVLRKEIERSYLKQARKNKTIEWQELDKIWSDPHREMQYFVCDYLIRMQKFISFENLIKVEKYVRSKQWWDTIDSLIKVYGQIGLRDSRVSQLMLTWSKDSDFWVRRLAIEHQLLRKEKTDQELLRNIIENNLNSKEFFINKAIGWALRDYSKTNPSWVSDFIDHHQEGLSNLSIKEGSKYLN